MKKFCENQGNYDSAIEAEKSLELHKEMEKGKFVSVVTLGVNDQGHVFTGISHKDICVDCLISLLEQCVDQIKNKTNKL